MAHQNIRVQFDELFRESFNSIGVGISPAIVDANILTICPTEFLEPLLKYRYALRTSASLFATAINTPTRRMRSGAAHVLLAAKWSLLHRSCL